jgi:hypothetical protein
MSYEILDEIPIPKKQRPPKYEWDTDVIKTVMALRSATPSFSFMSAIHSALEDTLTENQMIDVDVHYRRIYDRIKLSYPDVE